MSRTCVSCDGSVDEWGLHASVRCTRGCTAWLHRMCVCDVLGTDGEDRAEAANGEPEEEDIPCCITRRCAGSIALVLLKEGFTITAVGFNSGAIMNEPEAQELVGSTEMLDDESDGVHHNGATSAGASSAAVFVAPLEGEQFFGFDAEGEGQVFHAPEEQRPQPVFASSSVSSPPVSLSSVSSSSSAAAAAPVSSPVSSSSSSVLPSGGPRSNDNAASSYSPKRDASAQQPSPTLNAAEAKAAIAAAKQAAALEKLQQRQAAKQAAAAEALRVAAEQAEREKHRAPTPKAAVAAASPSPKLQTKVQRADDLAEAADLARALRAVEEAEKAAAVQQQQQLQQRAQAPAAPLVAAPMARAPLVAAPMSKKPFAVPAPVRPASIEQAAIKAPSPAPAPQQMEKAIEQQWMQSQQEGVQRASPEEQQQQPISTSAQPLRPVAVAMGRAPVPASYPQFAPPPLPLPLAMPTPVVHHPSSSAPPPAALPMAKPALQFVAPSAVPMAKAPVQQTFVSPVPAPLPSVSAPLPAVVPQSQPAAKELISVQPSAGVISWTQVHEVRLQSSSASGRNLLLRTEHSHDVLQLVPLLKDLCGLHGPVRVQPLLSTVQGPCALVQYTNHSHARAAWEELHGAVVSLAPPGQEITIQVDFVAPQMPGMPAVQMLPPVSVSVVETAAVPANAQTTATAAQQHNLAAVFAPSTSSSTVAGSYTSSYASPFATTSAGGGGPSLSLFHAAPGGPSLPTAHRPIW